MSKSQETMLKCVLILDREWSPTFLALGISFTEDNFSIDLGEGEDGFRIIEVHHIYHAIYFIIISIPPKISRHKITEVGEP